MPSSKGPKKPRKQTAEQGRWAIYMLKAKGTWVGCVVEAPGDKQAMAKAIKQLQIPPA
jgi:hypothetical protein